MASLVLGAVGGYFFGPIGFMVGSALGNLLTPQKGQEGPRLTDLKLQGSSYGAMIPIPYGTGPRIAPQVIWQTDRVEHKHTSGGKGGPGVTTYTYTASCAVKVCKGPIAGFLRIWADGKLVYDTSASASGAIDNSALPATFYLGVETAEPDPTMEAALGVGNVPAFRDDACIVLADLDLGPYGNRLPSLSVEVFTAGGDIPWRVSEFTPFNTTADAGPNGYGPHGAAIENGELLISRYTGSTSECTFELEHYTLDGTFISADPIVIGPILPSDGGTGLHLFYCQNNPHIAFGRMNNSGFTANAGFYYDGAITIASLDFNDAVGNSGGSFIYAAGVDAIYCVGAGFSTNSRLKRYDCTLGHVTSATPSATFDLAIENPDRWQITVDDDENVWAACGHTAALSTDITCYKFDADLNVLDSWTKSEVPTGLSATKFNEGHINFTVYRGNVAYAGSNDLIVYTPAHPTWLTVGSIVSNPGGNAISLGNGLGLDAIGVFSLNPPAIAAILGDIVADLSDKAGLDGAEYDTSELTDEVPGYLITSRGEVRAGILPLMSAYFFDGVESSGVVVYHKRGQASVVTIPDDELAARMDGDTAPALVAIKRAQEVDLPAQVDVTYFNVDQDYQNNTQRARRQVTQSQSIAELQLAIALEDNTARRIAMITLYEAWWRRDSMVIAVSRKYAWLEPTDVIEAGGFSIQIIHKTQRAGGVIVLEGVRAGQHIYQSAPPGTATLAPPPQTSNPSQRTELLLLDIPLVDETDDENGFYAAMAGAVDDTWRGAALYKSADGGSTYVAQVSDSVIDAMGTTLDVLGDWSGGNMFDEINAVTVEIGAGGGSLASASELAVLNGANLAVVGQELLQFKNAELVAADQYLLTGLLRGRRGTEWATPSHVLGERFALLPVTNVPEPFGDLGKVRLYKPVSTRSTLAAATAQSFTNQGQALRPYSPVSLGGYPITPFDGTVQLNWIRRTRKGGAWANFTGTVLLGEAAEAYVVQIWDSTYSQVARIIQVTSPTTTYTAAQQVADFGATQQHIYWTVGQVGAYQLGTQAHAVSPGLGASDDLPLTPVPPYNSPPPPSSGGCDLPTTVSAFNWAVPVSQYNSGAGPDGTWVLTFTTGAITAGSGSIQAAEYAGPPTQRDAVLALSPCGTPLTPASHQIGNTVAVIFYMTGNPYPATYPTLLPFTTYYFSIDSLAASGMICNLSTPH